MGGGQKKQRFKPQLQRDGEQDMKEIKTRSLEMLGCDRENWVSSLVRRTLAEPAMLSHLRVSPRQGRGSAGAEWDGCCHGKFLPQVSYTSNTGGALTFRMDVARQAPSQESRPCLCARNVGTKLTVLLGSPRLLLSYWLNTGGKDGGEFWEF